MDNQRLFLFAALAFVFFLIYQAWMDDYVTPRQPAATSESSDTGSSAEARQEDVPSAPSPSGRAGDVPRAESGEAAAEPVERGETIRVSTDVLDVRISMRGGEIVGVTLPNYPVEKDRPEEPVTVLDRGDRRLFVLQSGLSASDSERAATHHRTFRSPRTDYRMSAGQDEVRVPLTWRTDDGLEVTKTWIFRRGSYEIGLEQRVVNRSEKAWAGAQYVQLTRRKPTDGASMFEPTTFSYTGPTFHDGKTFHEIDYDDIDDGAAELPKTVTGGWAAMSHHYFVAAIIPPEDLQSRYYTKALSGNRYLVGFLNPEASRTVAPGGETMFTAKAFIGPKLQDVLEATALGLERTVDYGILTIIAQPLFVALDWFHAFLGNWGLAIILLTVLIKLVFYPLQQKAGRSMAKMRKLQPRIKAIKERYPDDRQKQNQAMMKIYQEEKINPAAGCLPILIQIPVFLSLYWVLLNSVELRQAEFALWLNDLSTPDPYYVLPVLMGVSMLVQQKISTPPTDPIQQKIMMAMPVFLIFISAFMPSGLVLYWVVNTVLSVAQQWQINRVIEGKTGKKPA